MERPPVGSIEAIIKRDLAARGTPAAWREIVSEYKTYIMANLGTRHADEAHRLRDAFQQEIEARAQEILKQLPAEPDRIRRIEALDALPIEALDFTLAGAAVRSERARLADDLRKQYGDQKGQLDRAIEEGDFDLALALLNAMLRYAEPARKQALLSLREELPEREARYRDPALRRLVQEYARVRGSFEAALLQRKPGEAYEAVARFLSGCKESGEQKLTRVKGVNYDGLLAIALDSTLDPYRLAEVRAAVERPWGGAEPTLAYEVLGDLQDAIDLEWLLRKAGAALRALLAPGGGEIPLASFGGAGRVALGPGGFVFQPKGGKEQELAISRLVPGDLVFLAAKDESQTVEAAFQTNPPLARAAGVCYRHSEAPDRWSGAARWFTRAAELKAAGPPGRPETMRELGRRQVRERLTLAQKDVVERRYEAAKKALAELETQAGKDKELLDEVGSVAAAVYSAELRQAFEGRSFARVKELARLLRDRYPGLYEEDTIAGLYRQVLWTTSDWLRAPMEIPGKFWDWEGKAQGAPAPAAFEAHDGVRLAAGKRLFGNPARAGGISGLRVQVRLNAEAANFSVGFHFDVARPEGKYRTFVLTPLQAGFGEGSEVGARLRHAGPLKKKPARGEWIDLAFAAEGGDLVGYVEREPVVACRGELSPRGGVALAADVDANFRAVQVRK